MPAWFTCQSACVPKACHLLILLVNVPINVPTCHTAYHVSTWRVNVPKGVPIFQIFLSRNASGNFYTSLLYKKFYILLDIINVHVSYIKIVLFFISLFHVILKESVWNFSFLLFFLFLLFSSKWKYKKTWFLYVTSSKGFLEFSTAKTTKRNEEYAWILWSSWIAICLSWRSEIVIRNLIMTMLLSVSYDHVFEYCSS